MFKQAFDWSGARIDFFAANAGTVEKEHITISQDDLDTEPTKPNMVCTEVNQIAVFYGLKLFVHYSRRTARALREATSTGGVNRSASPASFNPKMVITSSCSALYPFPIAPQYGATKHAVMSLTRAVGKSLQASDNIAVNCIMPAYVDTGMTPSEVTELWPKEWLTPISTMVRAYDELASETGEVAQDGKSDGKNGKVKAGQAVECVVDKLYYRRPVEYADESQKFLIEQSFTTDGVWMRGMMARAAKGLTGVSSGT